MTDLLAGRYDLRSRISRGGMGAVWRARDVRLDRDVAVKLLHPWVAEDVELRRRFAREARVLAPLEHEHVVRLYDYGEDGETPFLVMELVDGVSLAEVARGRVFTWPETVDLARPIASALAYAHARGIVHRDLTPSNVLIEQATGRVVVSDFGLARLARSATSVTTQGMLLGTPEYWSPEQARGRDSETGTDMYALGCLLFWLLSGHTPFEGDDRLAVGLRRAHEAAPSLRAAAADAPPEAVGLVDRLLAERPADRPTAADVLALFGGAPVLLSAGDDGTTPSEAGTVALPDPPPTSVIEPPHRHRARPRRGRAMVLVAAGTVAAAALAFVGATIANADRAVEVPAVRGLTVAQARAALADAAHVAPERAPLEIAGRSYSETVAAGHVLGQSPREGSRVKRADLDLRVRVSLGSAWATVPDVVGVSRAAAEAALRSSGFRAEASGEESWDVERGIVVRSDVEPGATARRPGPIHLVVSEGPPRASVPDLRGISADDAAARVDGTFGVDVTEEGSASVAPGTVLRQLPAPGTRAVLGTKIELVVARELQWSEVWSDSGSGDYDGPDVRVAVPEGRWRIVYELHPRYLIFGSGHAAFSWDGTGAGEVSLDATGSDVVEPASGAGTYRLHVRPHGSVDWVVRVEALR